MVKLEFWVPGATKEDVRAAVHAIVTEFDPRTGDRPASSPQSFFRPFWSEPPHGCCDRNFLDCAGHPGGA